MIREQHCSTFTPVSGFGHLLVLYPDYHIQCNSDSREHMAKKIFLFQNGFRVCA
jgi:hypothetical protein